MSDPDVMNRPAPGTLPVPAGFPVTWENPDDERLFWTRERAHFPHQFTPMIFSLSVDTFRQGWGAALEAYELPVVGPRCLRINTYLYTTMVPVVAPPEELEARARRCQRKLEAAMFQLRVIWENVWLPEARRHTSRWESLDLRAAEMPALRTHLEEIVAEYNRVFEIHYLLHFPHLLAISQFEELHRDLFGDGRALDAYRLLQGFDNKTLQADRDLFALSRKARAMPEVRAMLRSHPAGQVPAVLQRAVAGRAFLKSLRSYLEAYGCRMGMIEVAYPAYIEDPTPVIQSLQEYVDQPDRDPLAVLAESAAERERSVAEARARLRGHPKPVVDRFELLLEAAQVGTVLHEDHPFYLEYPAFCGIRRVLLEWGRRLAAAGVVDRAEDVFQLTLDELRETLEALPGIDRHELVAERRAEMERFKGITPPSALGTPPPGPPADNPMARAMGRFYGVPPQPSAVPHVLRGRAGSGGKARGPARVLRSVAEADRLRPGDVLVVETTTTAWTPLFAIAAAVVTNAGGVLCHAALVAREYGIPAVVATGLATSAIRDGQIVEVDGDAGEVRIVSPARDRATEGDPGVRAD